jgi:hypothetical protein
VLPIAITADARRSSAIAAVSELLRKLRTDFAFVGSVARCAWVGEPVTAGAIDVLAALSAEGRHQVPMMAMHRGFLVDQQALEAAQELDLIPLRRPVEGEEIRIHVLIASNALYGLMVRDATTAPMAEGEVRVVTAEDYALMLMLAEEPAFDIVSSLPGFDAPAFNRRLRSIGLGAGAIRQ